MNRRLFFRSLLGGVATAAAPKSFWSKLVAALTPVKKPLTTDDTVRWQLYGGGYHAGRYAYAPLLQAHLDFINANVTAEPVSSRQLRTPFTFHAINSITHDE